MQALTFEAIRASQEKLTWLVSNGRSSIVVDPGDIGAVVEHLERNGLKLTGILLTHRNPERDQGVADLLALPHNQYVPALGPAGHICSDVVTVVRHGQYLKFDDPSFDATVIETPGHTKDHVAYFESGSTDGLPHLFCGSTLSPCGCGTLHNGSPSYLLRTLDVVAHLPTATRIHCLEDRTLANIEFSLRCDPLNEQLQARHRDAIALSTLYTSVQPTTLQRELVTNPYFRLNQPEIVAALSNQFDVPVPNRLAALILLRGWNDLVDYENSGSLQQAGISTLRKYW